VLLLYVLKGGEGEGKGGKRKGGSEKWERKEDPPPCPGVPEIV